MKEANGITDPYTRVKHVEQELGKKVADELGFSRFIPYIQLHEFEALLLVDPNKLLNQFIGREKAVANLIKIRETGKTPEHIDDGANTAPSKRIIDEIPEYTYQKAAAGPLVAKEIGLKKLRADCKHFGCWVSRLEALEKQTSCRLRG